MDSAFGQSTCPLARLDLAAPANDAAVVPENSQIKALAHEDHQPFVLRAAVELSGHDSILLPLPCKMPDYLGLGYTVRSCLPFSALCR